MMQIADFKKTPLIGNGLAQKKNYVINQYENKQNLLNELKCQSF